MDTVVGAAISGGGPKGSYATGFLHSLFRLVPEVQFDVVAGTSIGALIAPMVAQQIVRGPLNPDDGTHELSVVAAMLLMADYTDFFEHGPGMTDSVFQELLGTEGALLVDALMTESMVGAQNLTNLVNQYLPDQSFYTAAGAPTIVQACLGLRRQEVYYFRSDREGHLPLMNAGTLASALQPVIMPLQEIQTDDTVVDDDGTPRFTGTDWYCDGGVGDYVPIRGAVAAGATKVLAIVHRKLLPCPEQSSLIDPTCFPRDANGDVHLPEMPGAKDALRATIDTFSYQVGVDDLRLAVLGGRLSALRELADLLVDRVEAENLAPAVRNRILADIDADDAATVATGAADLIALLGLSAYVDAPFDVWPVFIPPDEILPKNDFDFSRNVSLFAAGQMECEQLLTEGLQQWLLT